MFQFPGLAPFGDRITPAGFPHSEISGSKLACSSPKLIAACHVFHRRSMPRHPPCALNRLTSSPSAAELRRARRQNPHQSTKNLSYIPGHSVLRTSPLETAVQGKSRYPLLTSRPRKHVSGLTRLTACLSNNASPRGPVKKKFKF